MKMYMLSNLALASSRGLNELLEILKADPQAIHTLTSNEKTSIIVFVAGLGMAVTFAVLVFLWFAITVLSAVLKNVDGEKKKAEPVREVAPVVAVDEIEEVEDVEDADEELVAVIAAAVAASMNTSIHNIVVRNIVDVTDHSPSWSKTGRIEQMNTRF